MSQVPEDGGLPKLEDAERRDVSSLRPGYLQYLLELDPDYYDYIMHSPQAITPHDASDWIPVRKPESEDGFCRTLSTDDADDHQELPELSIPSSPPPPSPPPSSHDPNRDDMRHFLAEEELRVLREEEQCQAVIIKAQEKYISNLDIIMDKEREISQVLGAKLYDLFVVVTQDKQQELDRMQRRLLDSQVDAESYLLSHEWRDLQEKLHNLNDKFDVYIKLTTPQSISAGTQTDELTLFLGTLFGDLSKMWMDLRKLKRDIDEAKAKDSEAMPEGDECALGRTADQNTKHEDAGSANASDQTSITNILNHYYEFSRFFRVRMAYRQAKLQKLLDLTSTELGRLQADLAYEEGRTANMITRMMFWEDNLDESKIKSPAGLIEKLDRKRLSLQCGSKELQRIAHIMGTLPLHFNMIDIHPLEEEASMDLEAVISKEVIKSPSAAAAKKCTSVENQREDKSYITELEAMLKVMQADEEALASHLKSLHLRARETKAELQKELDSVNLTNRELREAVDTVAGKLFEHRERRWDLSVPTRQMGEELISTLEKLNIGWDEPLIHSD
ncbi:hypothetical protein GGR51DRAFT_517075 [Nemania sp. FL0031]|nr:hypothetical protein GGR51DRAFT_517075 [Nemania sp. FL0031]